MIINKTTISVLICCSLLASFYGCSPKASPQNPAAVSGPVPISSPANGTGDSKTASSSDDKTIQDAVEKMLVSEKNASSSPIPKGSELRSAMLKGDVLTLDFSQEFNSLADAGDTTESEAQKKIVDTIRSFPAVSKLRVTVEGKPFNSQNTDWNTPFPVRLSEAEPGEVTRSRRDSGNLR